MRLNTPLIGNAPDDTDTMAKLVEMIKWHLEKESRPDESRRTILFALSLFFFSQRLCVYVSDSRWKRVKHGRLYERKLDARTGRGRDRGSSASIEGHGMDLSPRRRILGCARNAIIPSPSGFSFGFMNINARLICIMSSYCSGIETPKRDRIIPARVSARFGERRYSAPE